jgi:dUTP pyrophosphatase
MKIARVRDVKLPQRGTEKSAGLDFFIPNDFMETVVKPGEDILIPSGIKMDVPEGYMLMAAEKSGVVTSSYACLKAGRKPKIDAFDSNLILGAKIVDEDYQGEIHIHLINVGNQEVFLKPGMKITQFILVPVFYDYVIEVDEPRLFTETSKRGDGALGSTGSY